MTIPGPTFDNRQAFVTQAKISFKKEEAELVEIAYLLAKKFHNGQFRKEKDANGNPLRYFEHVRRVAGKLLSLGISDYQIVCAALLHDTIEDSSDQDLILYLFDKVFGTNSKIQNHVITLTKIPKTGYLEKLSRAAETGDPVILVKMADRLDNLNSLPPDDTAFCDRQYRETIEQLMPLFLKAEDRLDQKYSLVYQTLMQEIWHALRTITKKT